jgi:hypothetical protein
MNMRHRRDFFRLLLAALSFVLITGCGGSDGPATSANAPAKTTMLVYMVGSDLESGGGFASDNIAEMVRAQSGPEVNVVLQTGGAIKVGWTSVQRKKIQKNQVLSLSDLGPLDMGNPDTLRDFVKWGIAQFPAERYMLVLWDHGGGANGGFGPDEITEKTISLPALQTALRESVGAQGTQFELIGFDACLMASVEIAHALAPYGKYLAASQEVEPGAGWDWTALLQRLAAEPGVSGADLGRSLADSYLAKMQRADVDDIVTFSITDLSRVPPLVAAMDAAGQAWKARLDREGIVAWGDMASSRRGALDFQTAQFFGPYFDTVDLGDFLNAPPMGVGLPRAERAQLMDALQAAVVYQVYGPALTAVPPSGLSMYFPIRSFESEIIQNQYEALDFTPGVKQWITRYVEMASNGSIPMPTVGAPQRDGSQVFASISGGTYAAGYATLEDDFGLIYALKPLDGSGVSGQLRAEINTGWFSIGGVPVLLLPDESQVAADRGRYTIPVAAIQIDAAGQKHYVNGLLGVVYTRQNNGVERYEIGNFYPTDNGYSAVANRSKPLEAGLVLHPIGYDLPNESWYVLPTSFTVPANPNQAGAWLVTKGALTVAPDSLRLGAIDYLSRQHFSTELP